jgi:hypothetical protein
MYNTLRNEIDQMRGKKNSPNKKIRLDSDSTFLANELYTTPAEKNIEVTSSYNNLKTTNYKTHSPTKRKANYGNLDNKYIHKEYRHPGTFVKFNY